MTVFVGFTGTRNGLTAAQRDSLGTLLFSDQNYRRMHFHHGACKGADAEAALLVRNAYPDAYIIAHPGKFAAGGDNEWLSQEAMAISNVVHETLTHFARNRNIVDETELLIGCPGVDTWQQRGGTFYTLDYAIRRGKPVRVIWPNGQIEKR